VLKRTLNGLILASLGVAMLGLAGCGSIGRTLSGETDSPDEFAVVTKAPLVLPPDYTLRPPAPGTERPQELQPEQQAERALFPGGRASGESLSSGERTLLARADAGNADPRIRDVLAEENRALTTRNRTVADSILFWRTPADPTANVIDPAKERERLLKNEAEGKPANEGQTPTIERDSGIF